MSHDLPPAGVIIDTMLTDDDIQAELDRLRQEHADLSAAIDALDAMPVPDRIQLQRLKKRKLMLKDRIIVLSDMMTPDIIA